MNVRKKLIIAQIMPHVPTMMVALHVIVQRALLEMVSLVLVSNWKYENIPNEIN